MTKVTQRQGVYSAVVNVFAENGIEFRDGIDAKSVMTKEMRGQVNAILTVGFIGGTIELKDTESNRAKLADESLMREYVSGLQSNWLAKDERLNGGVEHEIKNPGSRVTDPQLRALKQLLTTVKYEEREIIQVAIDTRVAELNAAKVKEVEIDYDALPADLKAKYAK